MFEKVQTINLDLYPIPFSVINLGENSRELNKKIIDIALNVEMQKTHHEGVFEIYDLEKKYDLFKELQEIFFNISIPSLFKAGYQGDLKSYLSCERFWLTKTESAYSMHLPHMHGYGETLFNGVYYPTSGIEEGEHISKKQNLNDIINLLGGSYVAPGSIVFQDPCAWVKGQVYVPGKLKTYPYYEKNISVPYREGSMILFPNYLPHMVTPTQKQNLIRVSMGFCIVKKNK
jgi:hypothetical protein